MFKQNSDDDDMFFTPQPSSKLASLFGTMISPGPDTSQSLTYAPLKQPSSAIFKRSKSPTRVETSVILVKIVHAYKLINGAYQTLGKLGFAIIGNTIVNYYNLVLYLDKSNPLANIHVNTNFVITVLKNNYFSFFDEAKQNWCVLFENDVDRIEFSKLLDECNIKMLKSPQSSIPQAGSGEANMKSLSMEKSITLEPITETHTEEANDPKLTILKRMAKMGQSILPSSPSSGLEAFSDSDTENEIKMRKSKKILKQRSSENSQNPTTVASKNPSVGTTPFIPQQYAFINGNLYPTNPSLHCLNQTFSPTNQIISHDNQNTTLPATISSIINQDLSIFLSENRIHNSEVRINISKLETKIDSLMNMIQQPLNKNKEIETIKNENEILYKKISELKLNTSKESIPCKTEVDAIPSEDLQKEIQELKEANQNLKNKIKVNENLIENYKETINTLCFKYDQVVKDIENLKSTLTFQTNKLEICDEFLKEKLKNIDQQNNSDFSTFQENVRVCQEKNEEIRKNFDSLVRLVDLLKSENSFETIHQMHSSSDQSRDEELINKTNENINEILNKITALETAILSQKSKIEILANQSEAMQIEKEEKNQLLCEKLQSEVLDLKQKLSVYEAEALGKPMLNDMLIGNIKEEMNSLYAQLSNFIPEDYCDRVASCIIKSTFKIVSNSNNSNSPDTLSTGSGEIDSFTFCTSYTC